MNGPNTGRRSRSLNGPTRHLSHQLAAFAARAQVRLSVGVDLGGTSQEALQILLDSVVAAGGQVWIYHNEDYVRPTFHPKISLFKKPGKALAILVLGNLTSGGLFSNYEGSVAFESDFENEDDAAFVVELESTLDEWCDPSTGLALELSSDLLEKLVAHGMVPPEAKARGDTVAETEKAKIIKKASGHPLFAKVKVKRAPHLLPKHKPPKLKLVGTGKNRGFLMTLQKTDAGVGQTTPGKSRRSPEIFIPLAARDEDPAFWGWPTLFNPDSRRPGKQDRIGARMRIGGATALVNMMTWPVKRDFRLRSEELRSAGKVGDILRLERAASGSGFDYYVEIVPQGTTEYARRLAQCIRAVRNSAKRFGYY